MRIGITEQGDGGISYDKAIQRAQLLKTDGNIIITKHPSCLLDKDIPDNTIIHCTITGLGPDCVEGDGTSIIEPNVEDMDSAIGAYDMLLTRYGPERVVLRIDPIFPIGNMYKFGEQVLVRTKEVLDNSSSLYEGEPPIKIGRVRISFLDLYPHVKKRLSVVKELDDLSKLPMHASLRIRLMILDRLQANIPDNEIEVCGEPGMTCVGCVSERDLKAMGLVPEIPPKEANIRRGCHCLAMKTELLSGKHPCSSGCLYCYWKDLD
jgi:hypothetical protein